MVEKGTLAARTEQVHFWLEHKRFLMAEKLSDAVYTAQMV